MHSRVLSRCPAHQHGVQLPRNAVTPPSDVEELLKAGDERVELVGGVASNVDQRGVQVVQPVHVYVDREQETHQDLV